MKDVARDNQSTSRRGRRQNVAPDVSPGISMTPDSEPSKRAAKILPPLTGLVRFLKRIHPGLTPGATNMSPANAGSLTLSSLLATLPRLLLVAGGLGIFAVLLALNSATLA